MSAPSIVIRDDRRMMLLRDAEDRHGIAFVEVAIRPQILARKRLTVHFVPKTTDAGRQHLVATIASLAAAFQAGVDTVRIEGGEDRIAPAVVSARAAGKTLIVDLDRAGDLGDYRILLRDRDSAGHSLDRLDTLYRDRSFSFYPECSADRCASPEACAPARPPEPFIDVYARDAAGFRRLMLDRLAVIAPDVRETNPADPLVTLMELFAWEADRLSYREDAVSTEAFLSTARHRISVRRHARFVGYEMHDGASARAWVHVRLKEPEGGLPLGPVVLPAGTHFYPTFDRMLQGAVPPHPTVLDPGVRALPDGPETAPDALVFHALDDAILDPRLNELAIYGWGSDDFCLPRGAASIDVEGDVRTIITQTWVRGLPGVLLLDPVAEIEDGAILPGDIRRRALVRVASVEVLSDNGAPVTRIHLHPDDALREPFPVRTVLPGSSASVPLGVARGNLTLVEHGRVVTERASGPFRRGDPERPVVVRTAEGPLAHGPKGPVWEDLSRFMGGGEATEDEARAAAPRMTIKVVRGSATSPAVVETWEARRTLFDADAGDRAAAIEVDDEGRARVRFGDGTYGARLPDDTLRVELTYRAGIGSAGLAGAGAIHHLTLPGDGLPQRPPGLGALPSVTSTWREIVGAATNPLPAAGALSPEPSAQVKLRAPAGIGAQRDRAVTLEDVAEAAREVRGVSRASASYRFTGSFRTIFVAVDPTAQIGLTGALAQEVKDHVLQRLILGYDLEVTGPTYVPVEVELSVCVRPDTPRRTVEIALGRALGSGVFQGQKGFFHPDLWTFGDPVRASAVEARAAGVPGVASAKVTKLSRRNQAGTGRVEGSVLVMAPHEIARLDDDRSRRERGILRLFLTGGLGGAA